MFTDIADSGVALAIGTDENEYIPWEEEVLKWAF